MIDSYELLPDSDETCAHVRFCGRRGEPAFAWDARIMTREHYNRLHPDNPCRRQLILIGDESEHGTTIDIVLALPRIDRAAILKTLVMVRNYKALRPGRIEFGGD